MRVDIKQRCRRWCNGTAAFIHNETAVLICTTLSDTCWYDDHCRLVRLSSCFELMRPCRPVSTTALQQQVLTYSDWCLLPVAERVKNKYDTWSSVRCVTTLRALLLVLLLVAPRRFVVAPLSLLGKAGVCPASSAINRGPCND